MGAGEVAGWRVSGRPLRPQLGLGAADRYVHPTVSLTGWFARAVPASLLVLGGGACFAAVAVGGARGCKGRGQGLCASGVVSLALLPAGPSAFFGVGGDVSSTGTVLIGWLRVGAGPGAVKTAAQPGYRCLLRPAYLGAIFGGSGRSLPRRRDGGWPQQGVGPGAVVALANLCSTQ